MPTLIIHGEKDGMVPLKNVLRLKGKIPNAEMIIVPNATHDSARNNSKELSEAIELFLEKNKSLLQSISWVMPPHLFPLKSNRCRGILILCNLIKSIFLIKNSSLLL